MEISKYPEIVGELRMCKWCVQGPFFLRPCTNKATPIYINVGLLYGGPQQNSQNCTYNLWHYDTHKNQVPFVNIPSCNMHVDS